MPDGSRKNPFELNTAATDRFYAVFAATQGFLADGDEISTAPFSCPSAGATLSNAQVNSSTLTLDGVDHAANTVASVQVSGIEAGDLVEIVCTVTTTSGRIDAQSLWIKGVAVYGD